MQSARAAISTRSRLACKALNDESIAAQLAHAELSGSTASSPASRSSSPSSVTPQLGEIASELLSTVTDGKYDRLEFTEDYGIEVYDGEEDRFPLSQYSGGERDVIALCARLALSQVIGGQAATPIQFMVLDEVFGSLDIDRRRNLMEMLQRLMEENRPSSSSSSSATSTTSAPALCSTRSGASPNPATASASWNRSP